MAAISARGRRSSTRAPSEPGPRPRSSTRGAAPANATSASMIAENRSSRSGTCNSCCASQRRSQPAASVCIALWWRAMGENALRHAKLGIVGTGVMAEAILAGLLGQGLVDARLVVCSHPRGERREELERAYGVRTTDENSAAAHERSEERRVGKEG